MKKCYFLIVMVAELRQSQINKVLNDKLINEKGVNEKVTNEEVTNDKEKYVQEKDEVLPVKLGYEEVCINNTENKYEINEKFIDTDKDMLELSIEESNISAIPSHDSENSATLSISMNDPTITTPSSPLRMETLPLADPVTKNHILIVGLEAKSYEVS